MMIKAGAKRAILIILPADVDERRERRIDPPRYSRIGGPAGRGDTVFHLMEDTHETTA